MVLGDWRKIDNDETPEVTANALLDVEGDEDELEIDHDKDPPITAARLSPVAYWEPGAIAGDINYS